MTSPATYRNHAHYIAEGWSREPKESFKAAVQIITDEMGAENMTQEGLRFLDIGCATGEYMGYLASKMANTSFVGVDVSEDLLETGRKLLPQARFLKASALALPSDLTDFDLVCAMGCMSIFDETQIEAFWDNLIGATKPGGLMLVFSPLNEFGVDAMIRHRKRRDGMVGAWETGWNIFAADTISEILASRGLKLRLQRFQISLDLPRREDPIRTWTMATAERERQLTNGLKLLVDHYFMIVRR